MPRPVALACEMRVWRCPPEDGAAWSPQHVRQRHTYCSKAHGPLLQCAITTRSKFSGLTPIGLEISHVSHRDGTGRVGRLLWCCEDTEE
eukprot:COSAG01_NODE_68274_length_264_cov_1.242424_1_plen_88_part_11